jgi:uncharacterized membrane protein
VQSNRITTLLISFTLATLACTVLPEAPSSPDVDSSAGAPAEVSSSLPSTWCAAREVLQQKCQRCHAEETQHGAPFALVSYPDTQVVNARGKPRYELIATTVSSDFMPPSFLKVAPPVEPLTDLERAALLDWCDRGAPGPSMSDPPCESP